LDIRHNCTVEEEVIHMAKVERSVLIRAPLEKVCGFARDWQNIQRYMVYIHEVKPVTEKTIGPGARLKLRVKFLGSMRDAEWEGTEYTENVGWTFNATLMGRTAIKRWRFAKENGSTRVNFVLEWKTSPPVIGHIMDMLLLKPQWGKLYEQSFQKLKSLMEARTTTTAPSS
jgi:uncharacterized membrane protein